MRRARCAISRLTSCCLPWLPSCTPCPETLKEPFPTVGRSGNFKSFFNYGTMKSLTFFPPHFLTSYDPRLFALLGATCRQHAHDCLCLCNPFGAYKQPLHSPRFYARSSNLENRG
ncbi:hypothetical protein AMTRI_Chr09g13200 [Amborella trichopoda]